ncbi:precorrin-6y C5,15-methyltransferase (decarboxylating) subunit CbiE [Cryptosporangium aurantiacum]|uniref:Precorrin-6Y C5,15-methyltransferase (Decarboxylating) n=1 Tax=Cryptosporangium aurantiacum TaxID=134849 RepID=A0A1M7MES3_9ACTN|nr:precorrin-6y C5,15-methyltransferase (decarboxylating) subunit CbiE [Cryptosporangium aurantiacum]SHM89364.1 precorrin-6Y C5,15-methyltransferase (decarboxylating) [Cryptosporangium aurantiacum]
MTSDFPTEVVTVVGIGADGWAGLGDPARDALRAAEVVFGSRRQLGLLPADVECERVAWPRPMMPAIPSLLAANADRRIVVLASGDPMFFGIGSTLVRQLGADRVRVITHPSSISLACARLGWPEERVEIVSLVGRPVERLHTAIHPGRTVLALSADGTTPGQVAALLTARGYGASPLTVLEHLGSSAEASRTVLASEWAGEITSSLNVIAIECVASPDAPLFPLVPGLPDEAFDSDGQLTKREVRAITLARLAPVPGQLLWDVGAGAGSIAIEWLRTHRSCRAIAVEHRPDRAARLSGNAAALGVPGLTVEVGSAPGALAGLEAPDAVFIGGGVTVPGTVEACWNALKPGGRLVANAVTIQSEAAVADWHDKLGGDLTRIAISRAKPVGGFLGWKPMMPVTQWVVTKR